MKYINLVIVMLAISCASPSEMDQFRMVEVTDEMKLKVDGNDFIINGMNWDYIPVGANYSYSLWSQSDEIIIEALHAEMTLLNEMGVNAIRVYTGIPPKWIEYIYANYGIYTMLNHSFGRYGLMLDSTWVANTNYADQRARKILLDEVSAMVEEYKETRGLLLYLLGNENNYGLFWEGPETEDFPVSDENTTARARAMYQLFNEATIAMKTLDTNHPIAICNGDLQFLDLVKEECPDIDIFGTNIYRGVSFGDAFQLVKDELNKPIMLTEFGADAFHAVDSIEDQQAQSYFLVQNWKEIYGNASGFSGAGNSIGGFTFQFSDGWWKYGQTINLDIHDTNASWSNGGYSFDFQPGVNNMNEEWFGICAKGPTKSNGLYELEPRVAYYALKKAHQFDPYGSDANDDNLEMYFSSINTDQEANN